MVMMMMRWRKCIESSSDKRKMLVVDGNVRNTGQCRLVQSCFWFFHAGKTKKCRNNQLANDTRLIE